MTHLDIIVFLIARSYGLPGMEEDTKVLELLSNPKLQETTASGASFGLSPEGVLFPKEEFHKLA